MINFDKYTLLEKGRTDHALDCYKATLPQVMREVDNLNRVLEYYRPNELSTIVGTIYFIINSISKNMNDRHDDDKNETTNYTKLNSVKLKLDEALGMIMELDKGNK